MMYYSVHYGYAVGWFTLSLLNAGIAQAQSRSGLLWFILSLVFGPLATLALVLTHSKK